MNGKVNLRRVAAIQTMGGSEPTDKFHSGNTENELVDALRQYDKWHGEVDKTMTREQSNGAYNAIWSLVSAREQYAYEVGFGDGMRLLHEALAGHAPLPEIENRACEPV